jgi:hypothetical protein
MKDGDIELLIEIARFEDSHDMEKEYKIGWSWRHVRIWRMFFALTRTPGTVSAT